MEVYVVFARGIALVGMASIITGSHAQSPINGPMVGYTDHLESRIWLQCKEPCTARVEYWSKGRADSVLTTETQQGQRDKAYALEFVADQVIPGATYEYRAVVNERPVSFEETPVFRTPPLWKYRTEPPDFMVAMGSCAYINEPAYDRPGKPYGADPEIFNRIADLKPDLMLWLGDNTYLREPDWGTWSGFIHRYTHTRSNPEMQRLLRTSNHYAIWDDHDFGPNDADGSFVNAGMAQEAFDLFWANPRTVPGLANTTNFSHADVDFFLLDGRTARVPPDVLTDSATMLGDKQINWLIRALKYSDATFKLVAVGGQVLNSEAVYENYANYRRERQWLLDRLNAEGLKNVVFLTGDRHHTVLSEMALPNGDPVYDLTVSPLTSGAHEPKEKNRYAVDGTLVVEQNFATLRFAGPRKARVMSINVHGADGAIRWSRDITAR